MPEDFDHHGRLEEKLEALRRTSPEHAREFLIVLLDDAFKTGLSIGADDEARRIRKACKRCCCCEEDEEEHHHHHHHHHRENDTERTFEERVVERGERDRR